MQKKVKQFNRFQIIAMAIVVLVIVLVPAYFLFQHKQKTFSSIEDVIGTQVTSSSSPSVLSNADSAGTKKYDGFLYGISFQYPSTLVANSFEQGTGDVITLTQAGKGVVLQIYVTPYDENSITFEKINKDIPGKKIDNAATIAIGQKQDHQALYFEDAGSSPKTNEVWFVYNGNLFQTTSFVENKDILSSIFSSIQFTS